MHCKVCCNDSLYVRAHDDGKQVDAHGCTHTQRMASWQLLDAVVLLNSPETTTWDYAEYLRLLRLYRNKVTAGQCCYFVCADGAYTRLQQVYRELLVNDIISYGNDDGQATGMLPRTLRHPLCDVVIGDMDSIQQCKEELTLKAGNQSNNTTTQQNKGGALQEGTVWYETVDAIPQSVLDRIHERACAPLHHPTTSQWLDSSAACQPNTQITQYPREPEILPIQCQMTTDFDKCIQLLRRLHQKSQLWQPTSSRHQQNKDTTTSFPVITEAQTHDDDTTPGHALTMRCLQFIDDAIAHNNAAYNMLTESIQHVKGDDAVRVTEKQRAMQLEHVRRVALLKRCKPHGVSRQSGSTEEDDKQVHVLPNVAVLGGLGGRLDHEMNALHCLVKYATKYHIMLVNKHNVAFACWPNGVTHWMTRHAQRAGNAEQTDDTASKLPTSLRQPTTRDQRTRNQGATCGLITFGKVTEMETAGLRWNIVNGRPATSDAITQTSQLSFSFDQFLSTSNQTDGYLITIDLCVSKATPHQRDTEGTLQEQHKTNPPVIVTVARENCHQY